MRHVPRLAWVAGFLGVVMIGVAAFAATRTADGERTIAQAAQTAAKSVAGGVATVARMAGYAAETADAAKDCATSCTSDDAKSVSNRVASSKSGQCSFGESVHAFASSDARGQCSFGEAASHVAAGDCGSCPALESTSFAAAAKGASKAHGSCSTADAADAAVLASADGALTGRFMSQLSSACQSACGTDDIDMARVAVQPGAQTGDVTQCPVSGAVFTVREGHPGWTDEATDYYTCCGTCADILAESPERFLEIGAG